MEKGGRSEHFVSSIILLAKIQNLIQDSFFYDQFTKKISDLGADLFKLAREEKLGDVAQYQVLAEKCFSHISGIIDTFKEFKYLALIKNTPLLLKAESNLLLVKLEILRGIKELSIQKKESAVGTKKEATKKYEISMPENKIENQKLTPSKKKILEYIKSYPNTRTKDIIYEFNALSGRSVKRNLTDLLRAGLVKKRVDNKAVYYYANE